MSTTQGPYIVIEDLLARPLPLSPKVFYRVASDWHSVGGEIMYDRQDAERLARSYNAAYHKGYAEGQRSKQAELDKAVELLRELRESLEITGACETYLTMHKPYAEMIAYLSTLNPQPDAELS